MDQAITQFDWISWLASIPGIPAGWGETKAAPAAVVALQAEPGQAATLPDEDLPELKAA